MDYSNENLLVKDLLAGNELAFQYVVKTNQSSMLYVARSIAGMSIAEEIVQDAWISIIKALPKFERRSSLKTWSLRIVRNTAITRLKKESRSVAAGDINDLEILSQAKDKFQDNGNWSSPPSHWDITSPEALLANDELIHIIYSSIEKLPPKQQAIISMADLEAISMEDICNILEISNSNARVLLHRARTKIWQAIEDYEGCENVKLQGT